MAKPHKTLDLNEVVNLFRKSLSGSLSPAEQALLDDILSDDNLRVEFERLLDEEYLADKFRELDSYQYRPAFEKLLKIRHKRMVFRRLAVSLSAAAILFAAVVGGRTLWQDSSTHYPIPIIEPGKSLAVLTLSDGQTVEIDELPLCIDAQEGCNISYEDGELVYDTTTDDAPAGTNRITVPVGGECKVRLDDKTIVWLNADSKFSYPVAFDSAERRVKLQGEAYFEVTPDQRPFIVETDGDQTTVLGTSFGISAYPGETHYTTLVEGSVRYTTQASQEVILQPGEQAILTPDGVFSKRKVDVNEYVGWKDGEFIFRDKPLSDIMGVLGRWYGVTTLFEDSSLGDIQYTGNLKRYESINTFLELLERLNSINHRIDGNTIVLFR